MQRNKPLSKEFLLHLFEPDFDNGKIYWKNPPKNLSRLKGNEAGFTCSGRREKKYWFVRINKKGYKRGYLLFCMAFNDWPNECLDHINGDSIDDRPVNLRKASILQNVWNHKPYNKKSSLPSGVSKISESNKYQAKIQCMKRRMHLGCFDTPEEAHSAYLSKRKELYGEFA